MVRRAPRRRTRWVDTHVQINTATGAQSVVELLQSAGDIDTREWTITRLIGMIVMGSTTVAGAWGTQAMTMGIGVISREAVTGGAFPDLNDEADMPAGGWMWRMRGMASQNGTGSPVFSPPIQFDLRAQRKIGFGVPHLIINNDLGLGTAFTVTAQGVIRMLVLLP